MKNLSEKDKTLHLQFSRYGKNAREWMRKCALLLPEIERNRVWKKKGFFSIYEYAAKLAGMSRDAVNESLRILKKIEDKPELMRIVEEKGLLAVRPVATIVTPETAKFWAEKAKMMSRNTLETYVREVRKLDENVDPNGLPGKAKMADFPQQKAIMIFGESAISTIQLSSEIKEKLEKLKGNKSWDNLFNQFLDLYEEKIAQLKKEANKKFKEIESRKKPKSARPIPAKIEKYAIAKTNHTCAFPGCTKPAEHLHHAERFKITGRHDPEKIIPLCKEHHELAHEGLIENEEKSPSEWKIKLEPDITNYKYFIDNFVAAHRINRFSSEL